MSFKDIIFKRKERKIKKQLLKLIEYNAEVIMKKELKKKNDAEYLAITIIIDDLMKRSNGQQGYDIIMNDILNNEYSQHQFDIITYIGFVTGKLKLKKKEEEKIIERHK